MYGRGVYAAFIVALALAVTGCDSREEKIARAEAAENKIMLAKVRADLARSRNEIAELKQELEAVAVGRDELDQQVRQLIEERNLASTAAQSAKAMADKLVARSGDQAQSTAALEAQVRQLTAVANEQKVTIEQQKALIEELQKMLAESQEAISQPQEAVDEGAEPVEPNELSEPEESAG